jgi:hypothetical protein
VLYGPDIAISENKASIEVAYGDDDWDLAGPQIRRWLLKTEALCFGSPRLF